MRTLKILALLTFCAAMLSPTTAAAGPRDHQDGFFLRLSAGGGSASTEYKDAGDDVEISGPAGDVNIAIGGMVAPNLALHGTLFGASMSDPDITWNGNEGSLNGDVTVAGVGIGLTYYFMPANIYISGSVGSGSMEFDGIIDVSTDQGPLLDLTLGKEWWVGDKWALGAAFGVQTHSIPDGVADENWSGTSYTLRFTASMN